MTTSITASASSANASSCKSTKLGKSDAGDHSLHVVRHFAAQVARQGREIENLKREMGFERTSHQMTQRMVMNYERQICILMNANHRAVACIMQLQHLVNQLFLTKSDVLPPPTLIKRTKSL